MEPDSNYKLAEHLLVGVGSRNPVKMGAVQAVLSRAVGQGLLPGVNSFAASGLEVPSGVSDQPVGDHETRQGALGRANAVLAHRPELAWGVGLEGGVVRLDDGWYTCAWCVMVDRQGLSSMGGGLYMPLPAAIVRDLEAGFELGVATDRLFGVQQSKHAGGALGYLSKNLGTRQGAYEAIFTYALVKFLHPELYELI